MNIKDIKNLNKIESFNGNFAIYYNTDGMAGIINRQGEVLIEADKYDYAWETNDGMYVLNNFKEDINLTFDANTQTRYEGKRVLNHGSVFTYREGNKEGICTTSLQVITAPLYDMLVEWGKGCEAFVAKMGDKFGAIDYEGKVLLPFLYDDVVFVYLPTHDMKYRSVAINGEYFWIDIHGNRTSKNTYEYLLPLNEKGYAIMKQDGRVGIIDANENVLCLTDFTEVNDGQIAYSRIFWCTPEHVTFYKDGLLGIMDVQGNILQQPKYTKVDFQAKDYLIRATDVNKKQGLVTPEGKIIIPFEYDFLARRRNLGLNIVRKDGKYGVLDNQGRVVLPLEYESINLNEDKGLSEVAVTKDGECYFINEKQECLNIF